MSGHHTHDHAAYGHDNHGNVHAHHHSNFDRAFAWGISINLLFVALEAFFGWKVKSLALLADAAHNLGDVAGLLLAWIGAKANQRQPSDRYTYGWKRVSILATFANSVLLLLAMGSLAWEAWGRLQAPSATPHGLTVMAVAAVGIFVNLGTALLFMRGRHSDLNIRGAYLHMAGDALVSAGVVAVGAVVWWTGWAWLDPVASWIIALVIVASTWGLLRQSLSLMLDGVPQHIQLEAVRQLLESQPGVSRVHDLHVWATSSSDVALTAHLVIPTGHPPDDAFLQMVTLRLQDEFKIGHITLQVVREPFMVLCDVKP
jgi:cobalt-zinc-cadmium efflux system protein